MTEEIYYCSDCGEQCRAVEECFDYAGTHLTNGRPGTYRTGNYLSHCCGAELDFSPRDEDAGDE